MSLNQKENRRRWTCLLELKREVALFSMLAIFICLISCINHAPEIVYDQRVKDDIERGRQLSTFYIEHENDLHLETLTLQNKFYKELTRDGVFRIEVLETAFPDSNFATEIIKKGGLLSDAYKIRANDSTKNLEAKEYQINNDYYYSFEVDDISETSIGKNYCLTITLSKMKPIENSPIPGKQGVSVLLFTKLY